jgi:ferredoxin
MAYVIAEPCVGVKDAACVDACPVDAIHPRKTEADFSTARQFYISAEDCICCACCVPVCPAGAIYAEEDLPDRWKQYAAINRLYFHAKS